MHQYIRPSPRTASSANNPQTNPARTNNPREDTDEQEYDAPTDQPRSSLDTAEAFDNGDGDSGASQSFDERNAAQTKDATRLNQVVRRFFTKGALTIVSSRVNLPKVYDREGKLKQDRWFNVLIDDTDRLASDLLPWKFLDVMTTTAPPLIIEIYFDMDDVVGTQSLIITDGHGQSWKVFDDPHSTDRFGRNKKFPTLVLERWFVELGPVPKEPFFRNNDILPTVYKKAVVLFRSLFMQSKLLPVNKLRRRMARNPADFPILRLKHRIINGGDSILASRPSSGDTLKIPLYPSSSPVTERFEFEPVKCPAGPMQVHVEYRANCDFRIVGNESILSSRLAVPGDPYYNLSDNPHIKNPVPGSMPSKKNYVERMEDPGTAYGSLSTFHQVGPSTGTSPLSALRARDMGSVSPVESPPQKIPPSHRTVQGSRSSLRSTEAPPSYPRRPSVSFQPFKAGSLASSPAANPVVPPSPSSSVGKPSLLGPMGHTRNRNSLTTLPQTVLRTPSIPNETAIASSASGSPKPAPISRYSSSFSHRRGRVSSGGRSKTDDEDSSGKNSTGSGGRAGSGLVAEGAGGSSGSMQTDDDNLKDFIALLEQKKDLSFSGPAAPTPGTSTRRTAAALSKYQRMRESNAALTDSLSSSMLLHRSSSSSSRQLSSVPPMIAGTSVSTSSSPGKPISPHTPHTPAIPSRLSANSIIEYNEPHRSRSRGRRITHEEAQEEDSSDTTAMDQGTTAIDIPTSPRPYPFVRRSSSAAHRHRMLDDDHDVYGMRSASLPNDDQPTLSLSELLRVTDASAAEQDPDVTSPTHVADIQQFDGADDPRDVSSGVGGRAPSSVSYRTRPRSDPRRRGSYREGNALFGGRAGTPSERFSRPGIGARASTMPDDDSEPLLFTMSEIGAGGSRRSLDEARGGSTAGTADRRGRGS